jgi:flagellin-like protein
MTHGPDERKAVSPILATMLVVVITLVASVAVGGFIFGTIGQSQNIAKVTVAGSSLAAADFRTSGTTSTFTCSVTSSPAGLSLTNSGSAAVTVIGVSITWAGAGNAFSLSGPCSVDAAGGPGATQYLVFPHTSVVTTDAVVGQTYTGTVAMSTGARLLFTGVRH